jgi:hypothetical protein
MGTLTQLQQNRRVIQDFTTSTLAMIPSVFARLAYMASLRDLSSGRYLHQGLIAVYQPEAVQQALEQCHEEIFERILELPLEEQALDLRTYLNTMDAGLPVTVSNWRKLDVHRTFLPIAAPEYLKELFCSNIRALLEMLDEECCKARSDG